MQEVQLRLEGNRDWPSCSVLLKYCKSIGKQYKKRKQIFRQSAHLPGGDIFFGQVTNSTAGGGGEGDKEDEKSSVQLNGTLVNLNLTIYTHTYMQAQAHSAALGC